MAPMMYLVAGTARAPAAVMPKLSAEPAAFLPDCLPENCSPNPCMNSEESAAFSMKSSSMGFITQPPYLGAHRPQMLDVSALAERSSHAQWLPSAPAADAEMRACES